MAQSVTEFAHASVKADTWRRDQEAWNLPRRSAETARQATIQEGLDWEGFVEEHFPGSRRHNLEAIVSYAAYKRSGVADVLESRLR